MKFAYDYTGAAGRLKRYRVGATTIANIILLQTAADGAGLAQPTATSLANAVGLTVDAATYATTAEATVQVITNPLAVYKILLSGGATAGTQLPIVTNSAADTARLTVTITTGDAAPNSPTKDEGTVACIGGANVGQMRKITSVTATTAVATVEFDNNIASGDVFLVLPACLGPDAAGSVVELTSNFAEADATVAWAGDAAIRTVELEIDFSSQDNARRNSFLYAMLGDRFFD